MVSKIQEYVKPQLRNDESVCADPVIKAWPEHQRFILRIPNTSLSIKDTVDEAYVQQT